MVVLRSRGPAGVVALQQIMLIDKAWISRTISSLVAKGLVAAAADPADARRTSFSVTPKGRRAADALIERAFKRQGRVLRGLTQAEAGHLMALLARIQENVDQEGA
ncbi:MAG: winged helix-turn-helix transcriptional regulator [Burkholderiales bacterium]|nr:winged helix-turn-helix transcriptional regulator [Burkholderiales bacterium]